VLSGGDRPPFPWCTQEVDDGTGEAGFDDVSFDLIWVQYHSLKAGLDYGQFRA